MKHTGSLTVWPYMLRPMPTWNPEWASGSCPVPSENTLLSAALWHRPHGEQAHLPPSASCWRISDGRTAWYGMPTNGCSKRTPAVWSCFVTGNTWQSFTVLTRNISGIPPQITEDDIRHTIQRMYQYVRALKKERVPNFS